MNDNTFMLKDEETLKGQDEHTLFDRIINLKLIVGKTNKEGVIIAEDAFVIRSDYEMYRPSYTVDSIMSPNKLSNSGFRFRKCNIKPSIKVQYKQVSGGTSIAVDIFITNFFMIDKDGKCLRSFNNIEYPLAQVELMMGYWGQFKQMIDPDKSTIEDYFNFESKFGVDKIVMRNVQNVTTDKMPPDYTLHIHGYVGNVCQAPLDKYKNKNATFSNLESSELKIKLTGKTYPDILYTHITRRFLKAGLLDSLNIGIEGATSSIALTKDGLMSKEDANKYGIKVYVSDKVKEKEIKPIINSKGQSTDKVITFTTGTTSQNTMINIIQGIDPNLRFKQLVNGDIFVYDVSEESLDPFGLAETMEKALYASKVSNTWYNGKLPCVYNINIDAVSTITCPFSSYLEPFQLFRFASRYSLTSMISYYANLEATIYEFTTLSCSVSFATVEDVNEVLITAIAREAKKEGLL